MIYFLIFLAICALIVFVYLLYTEVEHILDNTYEIGKSLNKIERLTIRKKGKK